MILLDIQGNEIQGKEVVFEKHIGYNGASKSRNQPDIFERIYVYGDVLICYTNSLSRPMIYLGHLKDKE